MWSVPPPTLDVASKTHDVSRVDHSDNLKDALRALYDSTANSILHILPNDPALFPRLPLESMTLDASSSPKVTITDEYLLNALHKARLIKTPEEQQLIKKANEISSRAHETVMRVLGAAVRGAIIKANGAGETRPLLPAEWLIEKEAEAEAIFVASCRREGAIHQAYLPIVAASTRASTLHYCCNDKEFSWGPVRPHDHHNRDAFTRGSEKELDPQVLLIDAGCEWTNYASDSELSFPSTRVSNR
jgi:Xaa-Pro dipeptidase